MEEDIPEAAINYGLFERAMQTGIFIERFPFSIFSLVVMWENVLLGKSGVNLIVLCERLITWIRNFESFETRNVLTAETACIQGVKNLTGAQLAMIVVNLAHKWTHWDVTGSVSANSKIKVLQQINVVNKIGAACSRRAKMIRERNDSVAPN